MAFVTPKCIFMNYFDIYENFTLLFHTALICETWIGGNHQNSTTICTIQRALSYVRQSKADRNEIRQDVSVNSLKIVSPGQILNRNW